MSADHLYYQIHPLSASVGDLQPWAEPKRHKEIVKTIGSPLDNGQKPYGTFTTQTDYEDHEEEPQGTTTKKTTEKETSEKEPSENGTVPDQNGDQKTPS